ncbi:hypothetical protein GXP67_08205 [Rhodocytophaga rosea]|uniref:Uncharacterized protein n=1 Tax=Rhodocytophaga rosea TaxID=2704465 RepID=A0A6C0GF37_9BACT|nr:hypothetical protein [Rhodocytophaga rosea]QHT66639.1 hypothetical protein GXP67_08205 [Rhodocytophaga rosea]
MTQPTYPLIMIYNNRVLHVIPTEVDLSKPTPFDYIRPTDQEVAFDSNGNKWTYLLTSNQSNQFEDSLSKKLLLYLFPSPVLIVKPEWTKQGIYQLEELKGIITECISNGDGVISPFTDADRIEVAISQANSFKELYQNLIKYGFDVEENNLWREQKHN